jgi:hypothetical protein
MLYFELNLINILIIIILLIIIICIFIYIIPEILYPYNGNIHIDNLKKPDYNLNNKKVAICFSGQIRDGYQECITLFNTFLINTLKADVFCCFEDCNNEIKEYININLKPKKIKYVFDYVKQENSFISDGTLSMYNKIYLANKLKKEYEKENNFIYDYVIRIRPDLIIKEFLPKEIFEEENNNKIYMPIISNVFSYYGYPDFMAIGNSRLMDIYSNIFLYLIKDSNNKCNISETLLYKYLELNKIECNIFTYPIQLYRFKYDNFKNIMSSINYIFSLKDR